MYFPHLVYPLMIPAIPTLPAPSIEYGIEAIRHLVNGVDVRGAILRHVLLCIYSLDYEDCPFYSFYTA